MHSTIYTGFLCALAATASASGEVWESLAGGIPRGWSFVKEPASDSTMALSIALGRDNIDQLESKLLKVSTPGEAEYGEWFAKSDIESHFPVVDDSAVLSWLESEGITSFGRHGALVNFTGKVGTINKLLNTTFAFYQNGDSTKLRTTEYYIPSHLKDYIDLISPTVYFGNPRKASAALTPSKTRKTKRSEKILTQTEPWPCKDSLTPSCLNDLYDIGDYIPSNTSGSQVHFTSFLNQSAVYADLEKYQKLFNITQQNFTTELINGGFETQPGDLFTYGEANLDVQLINAISHPLPIHQYITGGLAPFSPDADEPTAADDENEPYLVFYEYFLNKTELPHVLSNSYDDDEQTVPERYAKRVCNLMGLTTLRGVSIIHASGDEGVGSACQAADLVTPQFQPMFPGTCPYATTVGGTSGFTNVFVDSSADNASYSEYAWDGSSGGFSFYFSRPSWQDSAITEYLKNVSNATQEYYGQFTDFEGRGFPDVSAHSLTPDYYVEQHGYHGDNGGTSAAAPVFAGIIGLLNDVRLRAGKSTLGYLNPFLYSKGYKALTDITSGSSYGCTGTDPQTSEPVDGCVIPGAHWNATVGWDPVTGLGTPNFQKLKELVMSL